MPLDTAADQVVSPADAADQDAPERPDVFRDLAVAPLPAGVSPPRQIVAGRVSLAGEGETSCTNQVPPSGNGDRWCAFRRSGMGNTTELWVIDVTRAMAGVVPACDGTSPDCLRLTTTLWIDEPILGPRQWKAHRFDGDTLLFHADALSSGDTPYTGPIYAWRPGWTQARRLAAKAYACFGHAKRALALCIDDVRYDVAVPVEFDLRAGSVDDEKGDLLPVIDHPLYARANRQQGMHLAFSDEGQFLAYTSARSLDSATPGLKIARVGSADPPREVLPDVMSWDLSYDGTRVFYLADYKDGIGTLSVADFPSGANAASSPVHTGRFVVLGGRDGADRGVGFFQEPGGRFLSSYSVIRDPRLQAAPTLVFRYTNPLEDFHLSTDGRYTGYAKADPTEGFNGYLVRGDGEEQCILNAVRNQPAFEYYFLDDSGLVFWSEASEEGPEFQDGWFGRPDGCRDRRFFARHVAFYIPIRNEGLVFGEDHDLQTDTFTLEYAALENLGWPRGGAVRVHDRATFPIALLGSTATHLVFAVAATSEAGSGLFLFGPVPFGGAHTP